jgi:hypothetical protein
LPAENGRRRFPTRAIVSGVAVGVLAASVIFIARDGADISSWLGHVWAQIAAVPTVYVVVACGLKALEVVLNTGAWVAVLRAAHPEQAVSFRQALGAVQGGIGIAAVVPPKLSGVPVLGLYRVAFPGLGIAALMATRTVQGVAASLLGLGALLVFGVTSAGVGDSGGFLDQVSGFCRAQPLLAVAVTVLGGWLAVVLVRRSRAWLRGFGRQLALSGAILRTPGRYALLVAAPTALAFACRWGVTGVLLAAFELPVSLETLVRVNISHGLARSVQIAPGGLGTTQAFDLAALRGLAPAEAIAAYSLAQAAILLAFNVAFALGALTWAYGRERTIGLILRPHRMQTA